MTKNHNVKAGQHVDFGARAREQASKYPSEGDPHTATPTLDALFDLLARDGHNVDDFVAERDRLKQMAEVGLNAERVIFNQLTSARASRVAILATRDIHSDH